MKKQTIIFIVILILLGILSVRNAKAEAPLADMSVPTEIQDNPIKVFAYNQVKYRWGDGYWNAFNNIIEHESKWDCTSQNPNSTAYGCGQFLNSTWKDTGYSKTENPEIQIMATIQYIANRYKDPRKAWQFWSINRFY